MCDSALLPYRNSSGVVQPNSRAGLGLGWVLGWFHIFWASRHFHAQIKNLSPCWAKNGQTANLRESRVEREQRGRLLQGQPSPNSCSRLLPRVPHIHKCGVPSAEAKILIVCLTPSPPELETVRKSRNIIPRKMRCKDFLYEYHHMWFSTCVPNFISLAW